MIEENPPHPPATPEERERAVVHWEQVVRPDVAPQHMQLRAAFTDGERQEAEERLLALYAQRYRPIVVGEALRKVLDQWKDPNHIGLESRAQTNPADKPVSS